MDPIVAAAGAALVSAMAADSWQQARDAALALVRRRRPGQLDDLGRELEELRRQVIASRQRAGQGREAELADAWRLWFQRLLDNVPEVRAELTRLLDDHLAPMPSAPEGEQASPAVVMKAEARGEARVYQAGRDQHIGGA